MKSLRASIVLPVLVLIAVLGLGAGTAVAFTGTSSSGGGNLGATQDVTGPVISEVEAKDIVQTSGEITWQATITWETDELSDSEAQYSTSRAFNLNSTVFTNTGDIDPMVTVHAMALEGLSPNKKYYFMVTSKDVDGNTSTDDNGGSLPGGKFYSFTTKGEKISELEEGDPTVTTETESGYVGKAFVGIWEVGGTEDVTGSGVTDVLAVTGYDVTLIEQGTGKRVPLTMPTSYEAPLDATGPDSDQIVKWPGRVPRYGTLDELEGGERVVVKAEWVNDQWVVDKVIVKPKPSPDHLPTNGVVRTVENGKVTILTRNGETRTFDLDKRGKSGDIHPDLQPGDDVTIFHGGSGKAKGLLKADKVANRLATFLAAVGNENDGDGETEVVGGETATERFARLELLLQKFEDKRRENLKRVSALSRGNKWLDIEAATARLVVQQERRQANIDRRKAELEVTGGAFPGRKPDRGPSFGEQAQINGDDGDTPPSGRPATLPTPRRPDGDGGS